MRTYAPAENPYRTLMVDLTHRCNMACANCYIPNRDVPDMDVGRLRGLLDELPRRTEIRLVEAEPTMRRDLARIIEMVHKTGHNPYLISNGLRLARASYVRALCNAGLRRVYISLNGADRDDWYDHIDNLRCAEKKVRALQNVADNRMLIGTGTILVTVQTLYVGASFRRSLLGGRIATRMLAGAVRWAEARNAREIMIHVTTGIDVARTDRFLRKAGFATLGGNYALPLSPQAGPQIMDDDDDWSGE